MTVYDLLQHVKSYLDHDANLQVQDDAIVARLNEVYDHICEEDPWLFLIKKTDITAYTKVEGSAGVTVATTSGSNVVTGTGTSWDTHMEGHVFVDPDGTEHNIRGVDQSGQVLYLGSNVATTYAASTDWSVDFDTIKMPRDARDYLHILDRTNRRPIRYIPRGHEAELPIEELEGELTSIIEQGAEPSFTVEEAMTATAVTTTGTLPAATYAYCLTVEQYGRESAPTRPVQVTTSGATLDVELAAYSKNIADRVRVYRRNVSNKTGWYELTAFEPGTTMASPFYTDDNSDAPDTTKPLLYFGPTAYFRMHKEPSSDTTLEVQYLRRPPRLVSINASPELPPAFHPLLAHKAAAIILNSWGRADLAVFHEQRGDELLTLMRRKHLSRKSRFVVRRQFDDGLYGWRNWRLDYGEASKL